MKKWECTVCGYIHEGDEPPEECPVCGADRSKFVEITEEAKEPSETENPTETASKESEKQSADMMESFQMGASVEDSKDEYGDEPEEKPGKVLDDLFEKYANVTDKMAKFHAHPISVHIPNGVLPVGMIFLFLALLFNHSGFESASFYNLIFVVLSIPLVFITGYVDWRTQFNGVLTSLFRTKMICAGVVFGTGVVLILWRLIDPDVAAAESGSRWMFFFLQLIMLSAAVIAGYLGGKLVFKK